MRRQIVRVRWTVIALFWLASSVSVVSVVQASVMGELAKLNATATMIAGNTGETASNTGNLVRIAQSIDEHIVNMDADVVQAINASVQSRIRELQALGETIVSALQAHATALGVMEAQRQFGGVGVVEIGGRKYLTDAHSPHACSDARRAQAMAEGVVKARAVAAAGVARARAHNNGYVNHRGASKRLAAQLQAVLNGAGESALFSPEKLMADGVTLTEEQVSDLQEAIINLTDPEPLPRIPDAAIRTDAQKDYEVHRRILESKIAMVQAALNYQLALRAPLIETDQGKRSVMQVLLDSDIGKRYLNALYSGKLELKTENGTLADVANMMAVDLFIGYQEWLTEQHINNLMAIVAPTWLRPQRDELELRYLKSNSAP